MGKTLFLFVAGISFSGILLVSTLQRTAFTADEELAEYGAEVIAREIALTGMNEGEEAIFASYRKNGNYTGTPQLKGSFDGGTYTVSIGSTQKITPILGNGSVSGNHTDPKNNKKVIICHIPPGNPGNAHTISINKNAFQTHVTHHDDYDGPCLPPTINTTIEIKSVGQFDGQRYTVRREYETLPTAGVPDFMKNTITSDGNFIVESKVTIGAPAGENADIHTNGNIELKSGKAEIHGFGYHKGNAVFDNGQKADEAFLPNSNPSSLSVTQKASEIKIPIFKAESFSHLATVKTNSDLELSGTYALGTEKNPVIWYVAGNIKTKNNVTFTGYGMFLVKGNVEIEHKVTLSGATDESTLGIYTSGNIELKNGNLNVAGQWWANGNVKLEDKTTFTGSITTDGNVEFLGDVNMTYRAASSALTGPFGEGGVTLKLAGAQEW